MTDGDDLRQLLVKKDEKIEFLKDHIDQLLEELHRKSRYFDLFVITLAHVRAQLGQRSFSYAGPRSTGVEHSAENICETVLTDSSVKSRHSCSAWLLTVNCRDFVS